MKLFDVNVLVAAFRVDTPQHARVRPWFESLMASDSAFGLSDLGLSGFLRVVTHPRVFAAPSGPRIALAFVQYLRNRPNAVVIRPGPRHWELFADLVQGLELKGNMVPDAYFAALAIESGCEWVSLDRDFAKFPELNWTMPP